VSAIDELARGSFQTVIEDQNAVSDPQTVLLCSGKIYYELSARRTELGISDLAILRIEQFYPFPDDLLRKVAKKFSTAQQWTWVQEEPENMGGWQFIRPRLEAIIQQPLRYIGREAASSPATGFPVIFRQEQNDIMEKAVGPPAGTRQQAEVS
jgi:2-oxoglutarate dehydrogenase E1 component